MTLNPTPAAAPTPDAPAPDSGAPKADARAESKDAADAPKSKESKESKNPPTPVDKYEIKVNGKSKLVSKEELIRMAQLSESANERFETAAQKERKADKIIAQAKKNPIEALMDPELGLSKDQIRTAMEEWYNREFIEPETLTAEQREIKELKRKNAEYEQEQDKKRKADVKAAEEKAEGEYLEHFQKQITDAIDSNKLPKTKSTVKRIAFYMRQAMVNGWEAPMELIIQKVREDRRNEDSEINDYSYDDIVDRFGEDFVKRVISENLKRLRDSRAANGGASFSGRDSQPSGQRPDRISMREAAQNLKAMRLGK